MKRLLALALLVLGCSRANVVARGALSAFYASAEAPRHDDPAPRADVRLSVQWVGHATALLQLDDRMIVTDPAVGPTVGVVAKRIVEPGVKPEDFPPLDLVVVSHMHFDHLSYRSLELLAPKIALVAVPDGGLNYLPNLPFDAKEVEHWRSFEHRGMRVTSVPARHAGWRFGVDSWSHASGGWVVEYHGLSVYFAGDTGYDGPTYVEMKKRWPKLDLALLPIAPMEPHAFMASRHMNGPEALQAFRDLGATTMVPIHYDTFINSLDEPGEAVPALRRAMAEMKVPADQVAVLQIGERRVLLGR